MYCVPVWQLGAGLAATLPLLLGLTEVVRVKHCGVKAAVTERFVVIVTETGLVVPLASPLQLEKV